MFQLKFITMGAIVTFLLLGSFIFGIVMMIASTWNLKFPDDAEDIRLKMEGKRLDREIKRLEEVLKKQPL